MAGQDNQQYTILYGRLSQEDERAGESNSIQHQDYLLYQKIRERKKASPAFFEKHEKLHLLRKDGCRIARLSFEMAEIYYHEHRIKHFNLPIDVLYYILALYVSQKDYAEFCL